MSYPCSPSYPTIASSEDSNTATAQERDLKLNFMKMTEVLKQEINKFLKEIEGKTIKNIGEKAQIP